MKSLVNRKTPPLIIGIYLQISFNLLYFFIQNGNFVKVVLKDFKRIFQVSFKFNSIVAY